MDLGTDIVNTRITQFLCIFFRGEWFNGNILLSFA